jgi:asparagine synthase (glutamine-hydrolysing)
LSDRRLRQEGFLDPAAVSRTWREHQSGGRNRQFQLWDVLMFQAWFALQRDHPVQAPVVARTA